MTTLTPLPGRSAAPGPDAGPRPAAHPDPGPGVSGSAPGVLDVERLGTDVQTVDVHWIAGRWTAAGSAERIDVVDPATEQVIARVPRGVEADADAAVAAAAAAFPGWAATPVTQRLEVLRRLVRSLEHRADDLTATIVAEVGAPQVMARRAQVGLAIGIAASFLPVTERHLFERRVANSLVVQQPAGVVAAITPWNVPLLLTLQKVVPALAAGCTVVLKPSELTPLNAYLLAEVSAGAGLPAGVLNVVSGEGPVVGARLAAHPGVDVVSLTGSTRAGRDVARRAAPNLTRVHLELGGKSASVVLADADLERAVAATVDQACFNTGQACLQWSRLLVPRDRQAEAVELAASLMAGYRVGDPRDPRTDLGPLVSAQARERVLGYVERGIGDGARLVTGGTRPKDVPDTGYYVAPTLFADVRPDCVIAQEEIFGPVLSVIPYRDEDDAVAIANGTAYGLHGAVWSADDEHALTVARRLRTGLVDVNGGPFNPVAPFGGFGQSGIGRECGDAGLESFLETTSLQLPEGTDEPTGPRLRQV